MKLYQKVPNCGPVPYPDQSGKMLTDGTVSGDEWEPLVALGFVMEAGGKNLPALDMETAHSIAPPEIAVKPKNKGGRPKKVDRPISIMGMALRAAAAAPSTNRLVMDSAILAAKTDVEIPPAAEELANGGESAVRDGTGGMDQAETGAPSSEGPADQGTAR